MRIAATKALTHQRPDMTTPDESRQEPVNQDRAALKSGGLDFTLAGDNGRALVPRAAAQSAPVASNYRPATFLAQLIATRDQAPQTRERRRAEPGTAVAAYRAMAALAGV